MPDMTDLAALKERLQRRADGERLPNLCCTLSPDADCRDALAAITDLERRLAVPVGEALIEAAAHTIYDFPMPDGDALAVLIHCSDYIHDDQPLPAQLADTLAICADIGRAVIAAVAPALCAEERERAAKVAENPGFIQARDTEWDEGVNYAKAYIARAIRALGPTPAQPHPHATAHRLLAARPDLALCVAPCTDGSDCTCVVHWAGVMRAIREVAGG